MMTAGRQEKKGILTLVYGVMRVEDRGAIKMRGHQKPPSPNTCQLAGLGMAQSVRGCRCSGSAGEEVGQHGNHWKRGVGIVAG